PSMLLSGPASAPPLAVVPPVDVVPPAPESVSALSPPLPPSLPVEPPVSLPPPPDAASSAEPSGMFVLILLRSMSVISVQAATSGNGKVRAAKRKGEAIGDSPESCPRSIPRRKRRFVRRQKCSFGRGYAPR